MEFGHQNSLAFQLKHFSNGYFLRVTGLVDAMQKEKVSNS